MSQADRRSDVGLAGDPWKGTQGNGRREENDREGGSACAGHGLKSNGSVAFRGLRGLGAEYAGNVLQQPSQLRGPRDAQLAGFFFFKGTVGPGVWRAPIGLRCPGKWAGGSPQVGCLERNCPEVAGGRGERSLGKSGRL